MKYTKLNKYIFTIDNDILIDIEDFTNNTHFTEIINFKVGEEYKFKKVFKTYEQAFFYNFLENHEYLFFENGYTGLYKQFDGDKLISEFFQINGYKEGIEKIYDNNTIMYENNYINNKQTEQKTFKNNKLFSYIKFIDNYRIIENYHNNGEIHESYKLICVNNIQRTDGEYIKYYQNKKINIKCYYNNGKYGLYVEYWDNGNIKIECEYEKDKLNGFYKEYYIDGQIKIVTRYKNNKYDGVYEEYVQNKLNIKCFYINGWLDGEYIKYYEGKDNIQFICNYKYNNTDSIIFLEKKYNNICKSNKDGEYIEFYENGNIHKKCIYKNNKLFGEYIIYKEKL